MLNVQREDCSPEFCRNSICLNISNRQIIYKHKFNLPIRLSICFCCNAAGGATERLTGSKWECSAVPLEKRIGLNRKIQCPAENVYGSRARLRRRDAFLGSRPIFSEQRPYGPVLSDDAGGGRLTRMLQTLGPIECLGSDVL